MERKFCKVCEQEFHNIFRDTFGESIRAKELDWDREIQCTRNYIGDDDKIRSCLCRLIDALIKYREKVSYHLINSETIR